MTWRTGFLLQGNTQAEEIANTDSRTWKAVRNEAYVPLYYSHEQMRGYFVVGPGERIQGEKYPWGWELPDYDDEHGSYAENVTKDGRDRGVPREARDGPNMWLLVLRNIPLMENIPQRIQKVRRASISVPAGFPERSAPITIPANSRAILYLDQTYLTTAYPEIIVTSNSILRR